MWLTGAANLCDRLPLELIPGEYLIGREKTCHVVVQDFSVSRRHAQISVGLDKSAYIVDLNSANKVYVNDLEVARCRLHPQDRIQLGAVELFVSQLALTSQASQEGASTYRIPRDEAAMRRATEKLTEKQRQVLKLLLDGCDEGEIAARWGCSPRTVHNHVMAIYRTLEVNSRHALFAKCWFSTTQLPPAGSDGVPHST